MIAAGRSAGPAPRAAASSSRSSASCASWRPAAERQCRTTGTRGLAGEGEVAAQVDQLRVDRREDAVVVEARLADRDDSGPTGEALDLAPGRPIGRGGVMRVDADGDDRGRVDRLGECKRSHRGAQVPARARASARPPPHGRQRRPRQRRRRTGPPGGGSGCRRGAATQAGFSQSAISLPSESSTMAYKPWPSTSVLPATIVPPSGSPPRWRPRARRPQ